MRKVLEGCFDHLSEFLTYLFNCFSTNWLVVCFECIFFKSIAYLYLLYNFASERR